MKNENPVKRVAASNHARLPLRFSQESIASSNASQPATGSQVTLTVTNTSGRLRRAVGEGVRCAFAEHAAATGRLSLRMRTESLDAR
jgi:hypothetical protein